MVMNVGIKQRGSSATELIPNVVGFRIENGVLMLDLIHRQKTFFADELVCCVPAEVFNRERMKDYLKPGYEYKETVEDVEL